MLRAFYDKVYDSNFMKHYSKISFTPFKNITWTNIALVSVGATVGGFVVYKLCNRSRIDTTYPFPVQVCNNLAEWMARESKFLKKLSNAKVIGLDCEWVTLNGHRNAVSLLQLATSDGFCVLIRLCNIPPWLIPSGLADLLSDSKIIKVGVGILDDAKKLLQDYGLTVHGCLDLRQLVQHRKQFKDKGLSLQLLSEHFLDARLKKNVSLSCSNWESERLTSKQIAYAAEDALAAVQIYKKIEREQGALSLNDVRVLCAPLVDVPYKSQRKPKPGTNVHNSQLNPVKEMRTKRLQTRKRPMYENCQLQAPDGEVLCSCDKKKAEWYVRKGRAAIIKEIPFTVRLNFEPSGRPILDNKYYIQEKRNCCVVCGESKLFVRKSVVPSEYRRYFPNLMKQNLSHDILLLCVPCHRKSNLLDQKLRNELAKECDAPIENGKGLKMHLNQELALVKSAAKALSQPNAKIPEERRKELEKIVCKYFKIGELSKKHLETASKFHIYSTNEEYVPHGLKVYQHVCKNGGLLKFETKWRIHFLETMKPRFMPTMWSVYHNHERLALQVRNTKVDFDIAILGLSRQALAKIENN